MSMHGARGVALALFALCPPIAAQGVEPGRPNFLVIVADDLGWGDLGCYGNEVIRTPRLDRLATEGARFTAGYAAAPVCSPSRAGLLTGRVPYRASLYDWIPPGHPMHLATDEVTVAEVLREAGYATSYAGKWHLSGHFAWKGRPQPDDHGFEHWFAHGGNTHHLDPEGFVRNGEAVEVEGYSCQAVATEAERWLREGREGSQPFLQIVAFHEPHEIIESPPALVAGYEGHAGTRPEYYASVENMDRAVGRLLDVLDELELAASTLVLFVSDHGPAEYEPGYRGRSHGSAGPFRGFKWTLWEGGLRVPFLVRWPGRVEAGRVADEPVGFVDVLPTFAALAGAPPPEGRTLDGSDVTPLLFDEDFSRSVPLHWHYYGPWDGPQSVLREGDWLVTSRWDWIKEGRGRIGPGDLEAIPGAELAGTMSLYDLARDPHQDVDRAEEEPERLASMGDRLRALFKDVRKEQRTW